MSVTGSSSAKNQLGRGDFIAEGQRILDQEIDGYTKMNQLRDWFNSVFSEFDLYLEDVWNEYVEGETHFEYILRSLATYMETEPLAFDIYKNHQDGKGVWHLDDYQYTDIRLTDVSVLADFMDENGHQWG